MSSYTILPFTIPYTREAQDALNMQSAFLAQTNSFSVPQNFAGIVNSGSGAMASLGVSGNASILGSLNAGPTTVSSLSITGVGSDAAAFTANSLAVTNASVFGGEISGTSAVFSGAVSSTGLSVVGVSQFSAFTRVLPSGSLQCLGSSLFSGMSNIFSTLLTVQKGITISNGFVVNSGTCSFAPSVSFAGGISDSSSLVVTGTSTLANVIFPVDQTVLAIEQNGVCVINLNGYSRNAFSLPLTANLTAFSFTNAIVNSSFCICVMNSTNSNKTINKLLSSGNVSCINTLAGNTVVPSGSVYLIRGTVLSSSLVLLEFVNAN